MNLDNIIANTLNTCIEPITKTPINRLPIDVATSIDRTKLTITLITDFPGGFLQDNVKTSLLQKLQSALPDYTIQIQYQQNIKPHQTQWPGKSVRGVKNTIAIASGKGGVGKSTVTVNLAIALAQAGANVGILDADIYGPSIPLMLGEGAPVEVHNERYKPALNHGVHAMSIGYLATNETPLIWRGPMLAKSLLQMLDITAWKNIDYLFIDLPPGTGDIQLSLVQKIPLTGAIIVTTPQNVATLDAQKALTMFTKTNVGVLGLVENMSLHRCSECGHQEAIFGEGGTLRLSEAHGSPLLGTLPLHQKIQQDCDKGEPSAKYIHDELGHAFFNTAMRAVLEISKTPLNYADKFPPIHVE